MYSFTISLLQIYKNLPIFVLLLQKIFLQIFIEFLILLYTSSLCIGYPAKKTPKILLENLNISLKSGILVCLIGQNGAGKSSLMRTLAGLQKPLEGDIFINDISLKNLSEIELALKISVVLSEKIDNQAITVQELVSLGRYPHTTWLSELSENDKNIIKNALTLTKTTEIATQTLSQLSDGQKQRVSLARALAQDTPFVLLDEPTAHLDLPSRLQLFKMLRNLTITTNKTFLISTHELDLALQVADVVWLIDNHKNLHIKTPLEMTQSGILEETFAVEGLFFNKQTGRWEF